MTEVNLKEMLEAGVHFGHKKDRWNPKMRSFIFTERNGVHIFDLTKTKEMLEAAIKFASQVAADGGTVLFVGTKNQTQEVIKNAADSAAMPYLVERWPGGMLTNFNTILGRLKYMKEAEEKTAEGSMTKKEALNLTRELEKLNMVFEGVKEMRRLPQALFVADIVKEHNAVKEAKRLGIPVIGIADSNANPDIEYPIPGNDDAVRAVKYIADKISEAVASQKKATLAEGQEKPETEVDPIMAKILVTEEVESINPQLNEEEQKFDKKEMDWEEEAVVKKSKPADESENK